ncbi:MAG: diguanylate cyclase, partial [Campylobacterota bacterium]|nr:diguanylate cyclase [Campylobacterota bacterium]
MNNIHKESSLQSHSVVNSILTAVGIVVIVLFFFIPYITEYYTIQTVIKHSKNAAKQIKLTRAYYVDSVVDDVKKYAPNLTFAYNHQGLNGKIPLPTTTIHDLSKIFSQKTGIKYNLYSQYPFANRKDRNLTQFQKNAIKYTQESDEGIYIKRDYLDGQEVLRVATTDFMTDQSCVDCHNRHPNRTWEFNKWKLNDKRGVLEVITPLDEELMGHKMMRNYIIAMIALAFAVVLFYLFLKMRQRENELIEVADNKDEELNNIEGLLDKYVISSKTDLEGKITYASRAFIDISGYSYDELIGQPHSILKHDKMPQMVFKEMWSTITQKKTWRGEVLNKKKGGEGYWVDAIISPEYDKENHHIGYNAIRLDITAQKEASYLAFHDDLTGLPNRIKFEEIASHAIDVAKRDKSLLAIMFVDLDRFKNINDTLGHIVGDELLKIVSQRMQYTLREVDTVARIG